MFNQLFAALIAFVLIKWLYNQVISSKSVKALSLTGFQRMLLLGTLSLEWREAVALLLYDYFSPTRRIIPDFG
ncbi:hypothetical protein JOC78_002002 [Bacillus ectoiniformans]|nr:hypothetical protein [Bacillus ectoiniformans]